MTRGTQLIQELILQGIRLWPHDGKMRYAGLPHRLTPTVKELLRQSREELLDLLTGVHTVPLSYGQQGLWSIHQQAQTRPPSRAGRPPSAAPSPCPST